ncbi:MAG: PRC-barrel domain-containing protein [Caldilineaceae bacterium]|nr:PRC-barrel domain-containing protein [Caldilineaceae bacterium]
MDVPINVAVYCGKVVCGRTTRVVLNPQTKRVSHVVVQGKGLIGGEYLVPLDAILQASPNHITLRLSAQELVELTSFVETDDLSVSDYPLTDDFDLPMSGAYAFWPEMAAEEAKLLAEHEMIPPGEVTVTSGAQVIAKDGQVGHIDELLTNPANDKITHLILRKGHLWNQHDVTIPVDQIERIEEDRVYLKLDKAHLAELPAVSRRN